MSSGARNRVGSAVGMLGIVLAVAVGGCSAGDPQITAKAAFFSDQITGAGGKYVQALPGDEDKLGADICRIFVTDGSNSLVELSFHRAVDSLVTRGYSEAEARRMMTDGTAAYCPTKSAAAASALAATSSGSVTTAGTD